MEESLAARRSRLRRMNESRPPYLNPFALSALSKRKPFWVDVEPSDVLRRSKIINRGFNDWELRSSAAKKWALQGHEHDLQEVEQKWIPSAVYRGTGQTNIDGQSLIDVDDPKGLRNEAIQHERLRQAQPFSAHRTDSMRLLPAFSACGAFDLRQAPLPRGVIGPQIYSRRVGLKDRQGHVGEQALVGTTTRQVAESPIRVKVAPREHQEQRDLVADCLNPQYARMALSQEKNNEVSLYRRMIGQSHLFSGASARSPRTSDVEQPRADQGFSNARPVIGYKNFTEAQQAHGSILSQDEFDTGSTEGSKAILEPIPPAVKTRAQGLEAEIEPKSSSVEDWKEQLQRVNSPASKRAAQLRQLETERVTKLFAAFSFQRETSKERKQAEALARQKVQEDAALAPLSEQAELEVSNALDDFANKYEVLVEHEKTNIEITREMMKCLDPGAWLNDEVINLYLALLKEREGTQDGKALKCHFFNTFFYTKLFSNTETYNYNGVRRWTSKKKLDYNLKDCDKIIVPVHQKIHWTLAVINMREKSLEFLDSMYGPDYGCLEHLARYIEDEVRDKNGESLDVSSWPRSCVKAIPEQLNGCDCGVFMVKYADYESRGAPFNFTQPTDVQEPGASAATHELFPAKDGVGTAAKKSHMTLGEVSQSSSE